LVENILRGPCPITEGGRGKKLLNWEFSENNTLKKVKPFPGRGGSRDRKITRETNDATIEPYDR